MTSSFDKGDIMKPQLAHYEQSESTELLERGKELALVERTLPIATVLKQQWRSVLIASVGFTSGLVYGYDLVCNGASISMPSFLLYFGDMGETGPYLPSIWTSLWIAMSALMQAFGAIGAGFVIDRFGRKWPSCASASLTMVGTAVQYIATERAVLMGGKMISGCGIGALMAIGTTYIGEVAPTRVRGPMQAGLVVFVILTQALALGIIRAFVTRLDEQAFRIVIAIQWAVGGVATITWALVPESPMWLVLKNKHDAAFKAIRQLYGADNSPNERLEYIKYLVRLEEEEQGSESSSYTACFQSNQLKRSITVMYLYSTNNIAGAPFLAQNIYFLLTAGLEAVHAFDIGIGGFGFALVLIAINGSLSKWLSRRNIVLGALFINALLLAVIGGLYWAPGKGGLWAIAVLMNLLISVQTCGMQTFGWPIAADIPSHHLRAKTLSLGLLAQTLTNWLFNFVTPYMYNVDSGNLGAKTGFIYAASTVVLLIVGWWLIPEVAGMSTEEIDAAYEAKMAPRKMRKFKAQAVIGNSH